MMEVILPAIGMAIGLAIGLLLAAKRFSLRTLLIAMTVLTAMLGVLAYAVK